MNFKNKDSLNTHNKTRNHQQCQKLLPNSHNDRVVIKKPAEKEFSIKFREVEVKREQDIVDSESKYFLECLVDIGETLIGSTEETNEAKPKTVHSDVGRIDATNEESDRSIRKLGNARPDILSLSLNKYHNNVPFKITKGYTGFQHQSEAIPNKTKKGSQLDSHYSCPFSPLCLFTLNRSF